MDIDDVINVYKDDEFQKSVDIQARKIVAIIEEYKELTNDNELNYKYRIKTAESLRQKLQNRGYYQKWNLSELSKIEDVRIKLLENVPDLIGIRVNCYFKEDEKTIFSSLKDHLQNNEIEVEKKQDENLKQANGHDIYKVACKYTDQSTNTKYCFEIQVKSLIHDVWGEVEHKLIYKSSYFDSRNIVKKNVIEAIHSVLGGVDEQLAVLFKAEINEEQAKQDLFYQYTREEDEIKKEATLGVHYNNFFSILNYIDPKKEIFDRFLGNKLLGQNFSQPNVPSYSDENTEIVKEILEKCDKYKLKVVYMIAKNLYAYSDENELLTHTVGEILKVIKENEENEFSEEFNEEVSEEYNENKKNDRVQTICENLECLIDQKESDVHGNFKSE